MFKSLIEILLALAGIYALLGAVFAAAFHAGGLRRLDHGSHDAGWFFRVLITPGVIALWPLLAMKWLRARRGGSFAGEANRPVSPERIRGLHSLCWKLLAVAVPLLFAAALYWRPANEAQNSKAKVQGKLQAPSFKPANVASPLRLEAWSFPGPLTFSL